MEKALLGLSIWSVGFRCRYDECINFFATNRQDTSHYFVGFACARCHNASHDWSNSICR